MAEVWASVPGRVADDTANVLMRWSGGAKGSMWVTNAAAGGVHGLSLPHPRRHRRPRMAPGAAQRVAAPAPDGTEVTITRRLHGVLSPAGERAARIEVGHPEGYQEAFANLYKDVAEVIAAKIAGTQCDPLALDFPTVEDGARGVAMIEACLESSRTGAWVRAGLSL